MHPQLTPEASKESLIRAFTTNPPSTKPILLDLNPSLTYTQLHPKHATNIPYLKLKDRLHELPPPPCKVLVLVKRRHQRDALNLLESRGYTAVPLQYPIGQLVSGRSTRASWRPAPIVEAFVTSSRLRGTALDIACGSGRDTKFLTMHGFSVTAVDRDPKLLEKARKLHMTEYYDPRWETLSKGSLTTIQRTFGADRHDDIEFLRLHRADLVIVVRFLRRGVLEHLHESVAPGGYVLYEHFMEGCENFGGPMKKSQMLRKGELGQVFSSERGFDIIRDDEETLDDGRPVARFIARRRR